MRNDSTSSWKFATSFHTFTVMLFDESVVPVAALSPARNRRFRNAVILNIVVLFTVTISTNIPSVIDPCCIKRRQGLFARFFPGEIEIRPAIIVHFLDKNTLVRDDVEDPRLQSHP